VRSFVSGTAYLEGLLAKYEMKPNLITSLAAGIAADSLRQSA
jgi:hypothetical protein